jgi:cytochrome c-type biogenesis protein CcmF
MLPVLVLALAVAQGEVQMESAAGAPPPDLVAKKLGYDLEKLPRISSEQSALAREIGRDVVCLCGTCPKEPMSYCRCGWAGMNKRTIQQAVVAGMSREDIVRTYREAYGDKVLAMLPNEGFARTAWILPYTFAGVMLVLFLFVGGRYLRRARLQREAAAGGPDLSPETEGREDAKKELARELRELD